MSVKSGLSKVDAYPASVFSKQEQEIDARSQASRVTAKSKLSLLSMSQRGKSCDQILKVADQPFSLCCSGQAGRR